MKNPPNVQRPALWRLAVGATLGLLAGMAWFARRASPITPDFAAQAAGLDGLSASQLALQALNSSLSAVAISDLEGKLTYINPAFLKLWGCEHASEVLGRHATEFWSGETVGSVFQTVIADGHWVGMLDGKRTDGQLIPLKLAAHLVIGPDGKPQGQAMIASFIDQTDLRTGERALQHERENAQRLLDAAPVIVLVLDPHGKIQHANAFFEQLTGYRFDEIRGRDWFTQFIPKEEQSRSRAVFEASRMGHSARESTNTLLGRDRKEHLIEWYDQTLRDGSGVVTGVLAIGSDITERSRVQHALRESEHRLRLQNEHAPEAIVVFDPTLGRFIDVNHNAVELFGLSRERLLQSNPIDISPPSQPDGSTSIEAMHKHIDEALAGGSLVFEWMCRHADGQDIPCEVRLVALPAAGHQLLRASVTNITERKVIEQALRDGNAELERRVAGRTADLVRARDDAQHANMAKSNFLSRMSHELRTPMNAILGFAQVLEMRHLDPKDREYVEQIHRAGDHLLELINDLLDLSGIEAGRLAVAIEPVVLGPILEQAVQMVRGRTAAQGIHIEVPEPDGDVVLADPTRLRQILVNLLSNAVKYNRPQGSVTLTFEPREASQIRISVIDTGPGIAADKMSRIFTPFDRLGAERSTINGTGIGLALSLHLATLMGGELGVTSIEGEGSTFFLDLPVGQKREPNSAESPAFADTTQRPVQVLYVEDNPANLKVVAAMLSMRPNTRIVAATRGEEGLDLARNIRPDAILLDIHLPGMDGFEVLAALKTDEATRNIPVIAISADAMPAEIARGLKAGFTHYLTKPIALTDLVAALDEVMHSEAFH